MSPRRPASGARLESAAGASSRPTPRRPHLGALPSPWWGVVMLVGLALGLMALTGGGIYLWLTNAPPEVRVPDVVGVNVRAAEEMLARRGLIGQVVSRKYDRQQPAGTVIGENPAPGRTVRQGRVVELTVSDGPPTVRVPDVREMELERARALLTEADLRLVRIQRRYHDVMPSGRVLEQAPAPGQVVQRGVQVELVVSAGRMVRPGPVETPAPLKQAMVEVILPPGERDALVRIEVEDERGTAVAYSAWHKPGAVVRWPVKGYGDAVARVFVDNRLIEEKGF